MNQVREFLKLPAPTECNGAGVTVAVIDTGIDQDHSDFLGRLSPKSRSLVTLDTRLIDAVGHGTHVAGIIAGTGTASAGKYVGVSPGATVLALRVSTDGNAYSDTAAAAIEYAVEAGADVINYSMSTVGCSGGPPPWAWSPQRRVLDRAFEWAASRGVLCVCAAGNDGPEDGSMTPPGIFREILAVGCTGLDGIIAVGSSRGPVYFDSSLTKGGVCCRYDSLWPGEATQAGYGKPDVVAPGGHFEPLGHGPQHGLTTMLLGIHPTGLVSCRSKAGRLRGLAGDRENSPYTMMPGTSMACAVVSGMAALALQYAAACGLDWGPEKAKALRNLLSKAARRPPNGRVEDYGCGTPIWPNVAGLIEDCAADPNRRKAVLYGPQLCLLAEM